MCGREDTRMPLQYARSRPYGISALADDGTGFRINVRVVVCVVVWVEVCVEGPVLDCTVVCSAGPEVVVSTVVCVDGCMDVCGDDDASQLCPSKVFAFVFVFDCCGSSPEKSNRSTSLLVG